MTGARLEITGLCKDFRGLRAVHDVSFTVPAGAIHALIGPNGAGKTTIFNMIAGVHVPTAGTVTLEGVRRRGWPHLPDRAPVPGAERAG
jgi:branched-chain amino acid transport system ATP-binding protein